MPSNKGTGITWREALAINYHADRRLHCVQARNVRARGTRVLDVQQALQGADEVPVRCFVMFAAHGRRTQQWRHASAHAGIDATATCCVQLCAQCSGREHDEPRPNSPRAGLHKAAVCCRGSVPSAAACLRSAERAETGTGSPVRPPRPGPAPNRCRAPARSRPRAPRRRAPPGRRPWELGTGRGRGRVRLDCGGPSTSPPA